MTRAEKRSLPGAVRLAAVVVEEHARAAVQLGDDDALGAVDDERAVVGHERQLAEIDLLLADVLDRLLGARRFLVEHDQAHLDAQRRRVGQPAQLALLDVEHRLAEPVAHVLEARVARIAHDREHAPERRVQPALLAAVLGGVRLQELAVGVELDGEQVGHLEDARPLAEILADALLLGEGICHCDQPLNVSEASPKIGSEPIRAGRSGAHVEIGYRANFRAVSKRTKTRRAAAGCDPAAVRHDATGRGPRITVT